MIDEKKFDDCVRAVYGAARALDDRTEPRLSGSGPGTRGEPTAARGSAIYRQPEHGRSARIAADFGLT